MCVHPNMYKVLRLSADLTGNSNENVSNAYTKNNKRMLIDIIMYTGIIFCTIGIILIAVSLALKSTNEDRSKTPAYAVLKSEDTDSTPQSLSISSYVFFGLAGISFFAYCVLKYRDSK